MKLSNLFNFIAQLWKLTEKGKMLNKLRRWQYYYKKTAIPDVGDTGFIKVSDKGSDKFLVFHNLTKAVELAENISTLNSDYMWQWTVESSDAGGWSRISNADGLFLTSKLIAFKSTLAVEKLGNFKTLNKECVVFLIKKIYIKTCSNLEVLAILGNIYM